MAAILVNILSIAASFLSHENATAVSPNDYRSSQAQACVSQAFLTFTDLQYRLNTFGKQKEIVLQNNRTCFLTVTNNDQTDAPMYVCHAKNTSYNGYPVCEKSDADRQMEFTLQCNVRFS